MEYEIVIRRRSKNAEYRGQDELRHNYGMPQPAEFIYNDCLCTVLTEEQFQAIRKAVLEKF